MKIIRQMIVFILCIISATAVASPKAELYLWKKYSYFQGPCGHCAKLVRLDENQNHPDIASYDSLRTTDGRFVLDLLGPKGTVVTLFGAENYDSGRGYLTISKSDDLPLSIIDLSGFSSGVWQDVAGRAGESGAYSIYYNAYDNFYKNVASVKWGK